MKKTKLTLALVTLLFAGVALLNCTKKEDPAPASAGTTTSGTTPVSALALNTWTTIRGTNPLYTNIVTAKSAGSNARSYSFTSVVNQGTSQAKTAILTLAFKDTTSVLETGTYTLVGLANSQSKSANQVFITHAGTSPSGTFFSTKNGGVINVTNNAGVLTFIANDLIGSDADPATKLSINLKY